MKNKKDKILEKIYKNYNLNDLKNFYKWGHSFLPVIGKFVPSSLYSYIDTNHTLMESNVSVSGNNKLQVDVFNETVDASDINLITFPGLTANMFMVEINGSFKLRKLYG